MAQLANRCTPGRGISVWTPSILHCIARPNRWTVQEALKRAVFFRSGSYKYTPSDEYIKAYAKFKLKKHPTKTIINEF